MENNEATLEKSKKLIDEADHKDEIEILKSENENLKKEIKKMEEVVEQTRSVNEKLFLRLSNEVKGEEKNEEVEKNEELEQALKNIEEYNKKIEKEKEKYYVNIN